MSITFKQTIIHNLDLSYGVPLLSKELLALNDETESFIRSFGVEKVYKDYKEIINDAEIDAVMVCSSTDTHAPISIEAINAGKHVFCEKPLANTVDKILEIADALKAHPEVKFQVGFNRRFDHNFAAIRKAYDEGHLAVVDYLVQMGFCYDAANRALNAEREYQRALCELRSFSADLTSD